ncbi:MAG: hypothetical protein CL862_03280, partial [Cyanobium sp. NAT70]|nr:hypothetical protein [Cyanobium sp. NAT70]
MQVPRAPGQLLRVQAQFGLLPWLLLALLTRRGPVHLLLLAALGLRLRLLLVGGGGRRRGLRLLLRLVGGGGRRRGLRLLLLLD